MNLIENVRNFLKSNNIDYLLVNSTNEFLVEYNDLEENARYFLTNFSGSTGDAIISQKDIFLFVDGRYHEQADLEVNPELVTVVKMNLGESLSELIAHKIKKNKTFAMVSTKNSQGRFEILSALLNTKGVNIKLLDYDPVITNLTIKKQAPSVKVEQIDKSITGLCADDKFKKIAKKIPNREAILTTNLEEISYLCNIRDFSKQYSTKLQKGKCLVSSDIVTLFTDYDIPQIGEYFKVLKLNEYENYIVNLSIIDKFHVDKTELTAYDYNLISQKAAALKENYIRNMKAEKTKEEIDHYKKSFEKTDNALLATREFIEKNNNISEYDIAKNLEENFYKFGAKSLSFNSIVAKDKNSALAHYSKNSKDEVLKDGSLVLIDCGAYYEGGYATDCTRVFVKGKPSNDQIKVYTTVLKGFLKGINKKITKTTTGFLVDKAARKVLDQNKPKGFEFSHSLGHGIGISVHEAPPRLAPSPSAKIILKPNMCFTIEPGIYNKNFGGVRLENSCYLAEENDKHFIKSFSNMCFEKKLIDFSLLSATEKKQLKAFEVK